MEYLPIILIVVAVIVFAYLKLEAHLFNNADYTNFRPLRTNKTESWPDDDLWEDEPTKGKEDGFY